MEEKNFGTGFHVGPQDASDPLLDWFVAKVTAQTAGLGFWNGLTLYSWREQTIVQTGANCATYQDTIYGRQGIATLGGTFGTATLPFCPAFELNRQNVTTFPFFALMRFRAVINNEVCYEFQYGSPISAYVCAQAYIAAGTQNVHTNDPTTVLFDSTNWDTNGFFDAGTSRFIIPAGLGGRYNIWANSSFTTGFSGLIVMELNKNAGAAILADSYVNIPSGLSGWGAARLPGMNIAGQWQLAAGDRLLLQVGQNSGSDQALTGIQSLFTLQLVG